MEGYLALHRKITDNEFYFSERFTKLQAWIDLLILTTHKKQTLFIRRVRIDLEPGQLCYSMLSLSKRWKWNERTVKRYLNMLQKREMIRSKHTNVTTIISIKNWQEYQEFRNETVKKSKKIQSKLQSKLHLNNNVDNKDKDITPSDIEKRKKKSVFFSTAFIFSKLVNGLNSVPESADYSYIGNLLKLKEADSSISYTLKCLMLCYAIKKSIEEAPGGKLKAFLYNNYKDLNTSSFKNAVFQNHNYNQPKVKLITGKENSWR